MKNERALTILRGARDLLARPNGWWKGAERGPNSDGGTPYCVTGALNKANGRPLSLIGREVLIDLVWEERLGPHRGPNYDWDAIQGWNDRATRIQSDVVALLDQAITRLEATIPAPVPSLHARITQKIRAQRRSITMTTVEILRKAQALVARPGGWMQGVIGIGIAPGKVRVCALGAIAYAESGRLDGYPRMEGGPMIALGEALNLTPATHYKIAKWNDAHGRTKAEVVEAFDRAIAVVEAEETPVEMPALPVLAVTPAAKTPDRELVAV